MPILFDSSCNEHYIPLPSFPSVRLTPAHEDDGDWLQVVYNEPSVGCRLYRTPFPYMPEDAADTIARESGYYTACRRLLEDGSLDRPRPVLPSSPFTSLRIDGVLAGTIGIYPDDEDKQCFDVGYVLLPEFRGRGYMREAVRTLAETMEGWLKSPVAKWGAYIETNNAPSAKLLSELEFQLVREFEQEWPAIKGGGCRKNARYERARFDALDQVVSK